MTTCLFAIYFNYFVDKFWNDEFLFRFVLVFVWITYLWESFLSYRQYKVYTNVTTIPPDFVGVLDQKTFTKARLYSIDKSKFGFVSKLWSQLLTTAILLSNIIPYLWNISGDLLRSFDYNSKSEIPQTLVFILIGSLVSSLLDLPWSLYYTFVIEERYGFNNQTLGFYFKDKLKKFVVSQAIMNPIIAAVIYIIHIGGDYFFIYLWAFCSVIVFLFMTIYADYIAPLFDKFVPLPEGELRTKIEELALSLNFPLKKLYVVENSKRSSHSNAYLYGVHKNKRIVLFDTLLQDYTPSDERDEKKKENDEKLANDGDENKAKEKKNKGVSNPEIVAILAHELGHWKLNHVLKNIFITEINMFLCFACFGLLYQNPVVYSAFGFFNERPVFIGLILIFQYIFSPYNEILSFLMTCLSRRFEFQADAFAKQLNKASDLRSAVIKLNADNLSFPIYDRLYSAWYLSHPPLLERVQALGKLD
ncbi:CAAX prenyl protease 1-like protein [Dinothrombium tinctorium]|uniref:CAAX prenyl protease n=1 Tax=Dinothrombium tinctorium TaxID=1965070 RepID=A0A3S3PVM3_9ACAR|nr:CAAX prenyl protease 1-like protein [Dinothrombium tinctorium]RWS17172.1 CAAX prenyl protease 1-like protein [Dinothrombium tinctorium]